MAEFIRLIWVFGEAEYFSPEGWTENQETQVICPSGDLALRILPSCPAHAGHPVCRGFSIPSPTPRRTGSSAFADDDSN